MNESAMEKKFAAAVVKAGGVSRKWSSPSHRGVMDRIVFWPEGVVHLVELKTETGKMSPLQHREQRILEALGASVFVLYGWGHCADYVAYHEAAQHAET